MNVHEKSRKFEQLRSIMKKAISSWRVYEEMQDSMEYLTELNESSIPNLGEESFLPCEGGVQCVLDNKQAEILGLRNEVDRLDKEVREHNAEMYKLQEETLKLKARTFGFSTINKSDELVNFFTGVASVHLFLWIVDIVKHNIKNCFTNLSIGDHILIVFMTLRLGLLNNDIARRYGIRSTMVPKIYRKWLPGIASSLKHHLVWPSRAEFRLNMPQAVKKPYRDCLHI